MRQKAGGSSKGTRSDNTKKIDTEEVLDEKLRALGAEFLEEQVPDALLDVLRRGMGARAELKKKEREASESEDEPDRTG